MKEEMILLLMLKKFDKCYYFPKQTLKKLKISIIKVLIKLIIRYFQKITKVRLHLSLKIKENP